MNIPVEYFIEKNKNNGIKWKIDGKIFESIESIPAMILQRYIVTWVINQWEGIVEITTEIYW